MDRKHLRALLISGLCITAFIGTTAIPANAGSEKGGGAFFEKPHRYTFENSFPECDNQVVISFSTQGMFAAKNVGGSDGEAFLAMETYHRTETWTDNDDNYLMTVKWSGSFRETSGTLVDPAPDGKDFNGDPIVGPVYEFAARDLFQATLTLADGTRYREVGRFDSTLVFDTKGDGQPGGVPISYEDEAKWAKLTTPDVDICELALSQAP